MAMEISTGERALTLRLRWPSMATRRRESFERLKTRKWTLSRNMIERLLSVWGQMGVMAMTPAEG